MSLFSNPEEHAANPPATWQITGKGRYWHLRTASGGTLDSFGTKRAAEDARTSGFLVEMYEDETRWYRGESVRNWVPYRELADPK